MGLAGVAGGLNAMDTAFDTGLLPEAFATCACCVRESLDAAGLSLDCAPDHQDPEPDAWHMP